MAGEIVIPLKLWIERHRNPNSSWDHFHAANDKHSLSGWRFDDDVIAEINWCLTYPVPSDVAATPNGKIRLHWGTTSTNTSALVQWLCDMHDIVYNTTVADPAAWDDSLSVQDASNGAVVENECEMTVATSVLSSGRGARGVFRRDATSGNSNDNLGATAFITEAFLVADKTA